ncbi:hypothetical protein [Bdellovibrio sp. KM01]|uniref:hypothetical protein n=1 Tax=Bdellovibrio sp. KM01 TaxID=2748865 RepID=UPI0015EAD166|nr:hypothetical protein [Bdellovibrio sp. KM01]QLY25676.1 hypothetical protein HW988_01085 [Bdellovibrio sp. KM01]
MKSIYLILLVLLLSGAASAHGSSTANTLPWATYLAPDFVIGTPPALKNAPKTLTAWVGQEDCRARISQITCSVADLQHDDVCGEKNQKAIENLEHLYDLLQKPLQRVFCSLPYIFVVDKMDSLAMAGSGQGTSFMAISRSLVESGLEADAVLGWKEQKIFGSELPRYQVSKDGPQVSIRGKSPLQIMQYVVTHEFGHILDFANGANRFYCAPGEDCSAKPTTTEEYYALQKKFLPEMDSWSSLSWKNGYEPNDQNMFPLWSRLCFYYCEGRTKLQLSEMHDFYLQFDRTNFVTTYAATNPYDDFAESTAFYFMANADFDLQYRILTGKAVFFWDWRWHQFTKKNNWIELFYEGDLKYP